MLKQKEKILNLEKLKEKQKNNALLIAAAPDLLVALEYCMEYLAANRDEYSEPRIEAAKKAIAKAKGGEDGV